MNIQGNRGVRYEQIIWLGATIEGERSPQIENMAHNLQELQSSESALDVVARTKLLRDVIPQILQRELVYKGALIANASYASRLLGWIEILA